MFEMLGHLYDGQQFPMCGAIVLLGLRHGLTRISHDFLCVAELLA